jgi:hypothetical protein
MSAEKKKYVYNHPTVTCECGGAYKKYSKNKHDQTIIHRKFLGEDVCGEKRGRKPNPVPNTDCLSYVMNNKVADLTDEQHNRRKEYVKLKMRECRARAKAKSMEDALSITIDTDSSSAIR